jgi:hypothetical protein
LNPKCGFHRSESSRGFPGNRLPALSSKKQAGRRALRKPSNQASRGLLGFVNTPGSDLSPIREKNTTKMLGIFVLIAGVFGLPKVT